MFFITSIDYLDWVKAIRADTGQLHQNYIGLPATIQHIDPEHNINEELEVTLLISPHGANAIVQGIARLLEGPPPPDLTMPGRN